MAKIEELKGDERTSNVKIEIETLSQVGASTSALPSSVAVCKTEGNLPSSSSCHLKSYFIGMGFSPALVEKVIMEHGEEDADSLLETLLAHSALEKNSSTNSLCNLLNPDVEGDDSSSELFTSDEELDEPLNLDADKKSSLVAMNFSLEEIEVAIKYLGENAPLPELIDLIIAAQTAESSGDKSINESVGILGRCKETALEALFGTRDSTLRLLDMGFTEQEISSAIDRFGSEVPTSELADSIFANRIAHNFVKEEKDSSDGSSNHSCQNQNEWSSLCHVKEECQDFFCATEIGKTATNSNDDIDDYKDILPGIMGASVHDKTEGCSKRIFSAAEMQQDTTPSLDSAVCDHKEFQKGKRIKHVSECDNSTFYGSEARVNKSDDLPYETPHLYKGLNYFSKGFHRVDEREPHITKHSIHPLMSKPPFFFYGNVVDVSRETWRKLSQFLYGIEPEHANTQFFSAFIRKEGYLHNLPAGNRFHILPKPPMTIEDALSHTKRWWPSWDTRKQFSCISPDTVGVAHICKRLEKMLMDSRGILSREQQMDTLHQCKTLNLVWVGEHRLSPIEPGQVEHILGYPVQHTQIQGLEQGDRLRALKCCFQTDTLGYHVSVLKQMYPSGLRVLSIFSGIGGAEVALHRLGIHLRCVVSVEASEANRRIVKRWWQNTGQSGVLRQIEGIERLSSQKIETLIEEFGGFDIVIGGSPCTCAPVSGRSVLDLNPGSGRSVLDLNLFYEFVRVFQRVRSIMGRN
uniref:DNA (cytosine-5-)-methyltransferase n=1 Tax=Anthurium amnicola TaxID=1678845 RepID=A0A1D1YRD2_9ARAE